MTENFFNDLELLTNSQFAFQCGNRYGECLDDNHEESYI